MLELLMFLHARLGKARVTAAVWLDSYGLV